MKNNKSLGQHWLKNREILNEIADLAAEGGASESSEKCLEIGPGLGTLTSSLLKRFGEVVAVEFDERLANNLPKSFPGKNLVVLNEDILDFDFGRIGGEYVVVGNIPYYITSPIIEKVLTAEKLPRRVVLLMQKEVAERIVDEKETGLSLFVKNRAKVWLGPVVLRDEFTPPPKVDSRVLVMEPRVPEVGDEVFELIRKGFAAPRKKLVHNLAGMNVLGLGANEEAGVRGVISEVDAKEALRGLGISLDARPGDLKLQDWAKLYEALSGRVVCSD